MTEWLIFIFYWIGIMALIGADLVLVQKFNQQKEDKESDKEEK